MYDAVSFFSLYGLPSCLTLPSDDGVDDGCNNGDGDRDADGVTVLLLNIKLCSSHSIVKRVQLHLEVFSRFF